MISEVFAGVSAFKSMFDLARGLKDLDDAANRNAVAIELQERILAAQMQQTALIDQVGQLEKRVAELEAWDADKQRYELKEIATNQFAYVVREDARGAEPSHKLCANCFNQNQKSILQTETRNPGRHTVFFCQRCGADIYSSDTGGRETPTVTRKSGSWAQERKGR